MSQSNESCTGWCQLPMTANVTAHELSFPANNTSSSPLDHVSVKIVLILLYSVVFVTCFIGNILVILVITLHRQMRTITNFFLANLSVADLCVGIFCVMPNMSIYVSSANWIFGKVMCKLYYFIQAACYTASICILTVISAERYIAIIYPIHTRRLQSMTLLRSTVVGIWLVAAAAGLPLLIFYDTIQVPRIILADTTQMTPSTVNSIVLVDYCVIVGGFDVSAFNVFSLILCYVVPLCLMSFVYVRISVVLWQSSRQSALDKSLVNKSRTLRHAGCASVNRSTHHQLAASDDIQTVTSFGGGVDGTNWSTSTASNSNVTIREHSKSRSADNVLTSRRRVIRLLVAVIVSFAVCVLPYHVRFVWLMFVEPDPESYWQTLLTPLTFVVYYLNSALNPLLYAFLSDKFRRCLCDIIVRCRCRDGAAGQGGAAGFNGRSRQPGWNKQAMLMKALDHANNYTAKMTVDDQIHTT